MASQLGHCQKIDTVAYLDSDPCHAMQKALSDGQDKVEADHYSACASGMS